DRLRVLSGRPGGDDDPGGERHKASIPLDRNLDRAGDKPVDQVLTGSRGRLQVGSTRRKLRATDGERQDRGRTEIRQTNSRAREPGESHRGAKVWVACGKARRTLGTIPPRFFQHHGSWFLSFQ